MTQKSDRRGIEYFGKADRYRLDYRCGVYVVYDAEVPGWTPRAVATGSTAEIAKKRALKR